MTISPQNPVCPLADKGFLVTDAQTLPSLINAHPTLLVLLQSDPNKHPEVADSWVIIPEILKQFPATSYTAVLIHLKYEKNREDIGLFGIWRD